MGSYPVTEKEAEREKTRPVPIPKTSRNVDALMSSNEASVAPSSHIPSSIEAIPVSCTPEDVAFEVLDSDCDDTETEICFVDDDEELERAKASTRAEEDEELDDNRANSDDDSDARVAPLQNEDLEHVELSTGVGDGGHVRRSWNVLEKEDMVGFAKSESNMSDLRSDGWILEDFPPDSRYPGLYARSYGPTDEVIALADSPLQLFLFFMPKDLMFENQRTPGKTSKEDFMDRESRKDDIQPHEIIHVLGLLMARMLNPHRCRFRDHWCTKSVGAVPRGTFNDYMPRHRFEHVMANIHLTNNADTRVSSDRAWKIRSVVDTLQEIFPRGYSTPPVISFDEGIIPSRNRSNSTRQYLRAKPHKWGTKLFLTCCAETAYCIRLEVYCGKAQHTEECGNVSESVRYADPNTGPSAVIRNLEAVLPAPQDSVHHLDVTDRFYTSVQLALQLLRRNVYSIGTIQADRVGYPIEIVEKNRDRPKSIPHGTTIMAVAKICPLMTGMMWWYRKPVQFLGTGSSRAMETCMRRTKQSRGRRTAVPCPSMVRDYHRWMGGVDIHDQLRLQRYSLQLQTWCKKEGQKRFDARSVSHAEFMLELHAEMMQMTEADFSDRETPDPETTVELTPQSTAHEPLESPDYQVVNGVLKRRERQCKVVRF
ncbi:hypothetical protein L915_02717 [Phytophthora nicotianae]|uniref:PiggyBac transposable element-derived protein domain-containing protein n=1 Tax=Phytophthora nicotianae TaxID=4792 RepID=W2HFY6_PHYNI|nr:hypothetical protein L915_02717 [Phytophthora nicotianae]